MLTPVDGSGRQLAVYDPATKQTSLIDTCFGTHHLLFAEDADNTPWTSSGGGGGVVGWLNTKLWDQTHDAQKSQGWTAPNPKRSQSAKGTPASGSCPGNASKLADPLHHSGDFAETMRVFAEAERLQTENEQE